MAAPSPHSRTQEEPLGAAPPGTAGLGTTNGARLCPSLQPYLQIFFSSFILPGSSRGSPEVVSSSTSSARRWSMFAGTEAPEVPGHPPEGLSSRGSRDGELPRPTDPAATGRRHLPALSGAPPLRKPHLLHKSRPQDGPRPTSAHALRRATPTWSPRPSSAEAAPLTEDRAPV